MAPFNRRQIGYIQAIAGRQQHTTLICGQLNGVKSSTDNITAERVPLQVQLAVAGSGGEDGQIDGVDIDAPEQLSAKSLLLHTWNLAPHEIGFDARTAHVDSKLTSADFAHLNTIEL